MNKLFFYLLLFFIFFTSAIFSDHSSEVGDPEGYKTILTCIVKREFKRFKVIERIFYNDTLTLIRERKQLLVDKHLLYAEKLEDERYKALYELAIIEELVEKGRNNSLQQRYYSCFH